MNVPTTRAVRATAVLPHGTGKRVRIAVFAQGEKAEEAKAAGAEIVGGEDLVEAIQGGDINFDRCIASPEMMPLVGRVARILGPRGLMPNPKMGTLTPDVGEAVSGLLKGQVQVGVAILLVYPLLLSPSLSLSLSLSLFLSFSSALCSE